MYTINYLSVVNQNRYNNGEFIQTPEMEMERISDQRYRMAHYEAIDFTDILDLVKTVKVFQQEKVIGYSLSYEKLVIEEYAENYLIEAETEYIIEICMKLEETGYEYKVVGENNFISVQKSRRTNFQERLDRHKWIRALY